jgi:hypothetical protein
MEQPAIKKWREGIRQHHRRLAERAQPAPRGIAFVIAFMRFVKCNDFDGLIRKGSTYLSDKLPQYLDYLRKQGKSNDNIRKQWRTIHSFFRYNEMPLNDKLPRTYKSKV